SSALIFTSAFWAYLFGYKFFGVRWRRARLHSPLEFLTRRYSPSTTYFYSLATIIPQTVGIGQGLYILCIFVSTALGFNDRVFDFGVIAISGFQLSIILSGSIMVIYSVIGGLWAAVLSDTVQAIIITVMTIIIAPVSYNYLGQGSGIIAGFERLLKEAPQSYFSLIGDMANPLFLISYFINVMLGYNVGWGLVQRYIGVPDERDAKKMALLCAVLSVVGPMLWILPVMAARVIFPDMNLLWPTFAVPAEASFVSLALALLPHGLIGFVVSAILSATLGQANDSFNWLAATLSRDVYTPLKKRLTGVSPSDSKQLFIARMTMLVVGVLGIGVALYIPKLGGAFQFALGFYSLTAAFAMPVFLGLLYTRTPWWSGIASCAAAIIVALILMSTEIWNEQVFVRNMLSESFTALIVFFGSSIWYKHDDPRNEELVRFQEDLRTPVRLAEKETTFAGLAVYNLIGRICFVLGGVLLLCTLLPSKPVAPATLNAVAGLLLIVLGVFIWFRTRATGELLKREH
ncbi:MAG: hypothetical protein HY089_00755, partial [Ignavibacteriales bacterium]|nr:hypothetical protein [Ignavibacteriales bacterium]